MWFYNRVLCIAAVLGVSRALAPTNVTWSSCPQANNTATECATVQVPLDWADESKGMIPIALSRLPAATPQREGFMFFNPGGPGGSGTEFIQTVGDLLQGVLGAGWDVISWDPRGIGGSGPNISLFANDAEYINFFNSFIGRDRLTGHGNLTTSSDVDLFMSQVSTFDAVAIATSQKMIEKNGDSLKYVGSCAVVRDLVYLVDSVYGEGTDVNFWGISYGTVLAGYLTQMFPDRVGKVILDGVLDPEKYGNSIPAKWMDVDIYDVDFVLKSWTEACAGSRRCPFSSQNDTSAALLSNIDTILNTAYQKYDGSTPSLQLSGLATWPYDSLAYFIQSQLYFSMSDDTLAQVLAAIEQLQSNSTSRSGKELPLDFPIPVRRFPYLPIPSYVLPPDVLSGVGIAVFCGDTVDDSTTTSEDVFKEVVRVSQSVSRIFGSLIPINNVRPLCHKWTSRAVERLPQKFTKQPKNVVLVMSTMADPITPYYSARRLASSDVLGSKARLVRLNSVGHSTLSNNSTCIFNTVQKFLAGNIPADAGNDEADVTCNIQETVFGPVPTTWQNFTYTQMHNETSTSNSPTSPSSATARLA
ncbi:hypothetical protein FRC17_002556, partial [Serendipita sp. 399]